MSSHYQNDGFNIRNRICVLFWSTCDQPQFLVGATFVLISLVIYVVFSVMFYLFLFLLWHRQFVFEFAHPFGTFDLWYLRYSVLYVPANLMQSEGFVISNDRHGGQKFKKPVMIRIHSEIHYCNVTP